MAMPPLMLRLALWIVRAIAVLVPAAQRASWRHEWEAELTHQSARSDSRVQVIRRALGALPDAAWLRRQFTLDADAVQDATHYVRALLKTPGFTAITLLVFAVGVGTTTAIVSVADTLFLRPLPVRQPDRVMTIWQHNSATGAERLDVAPANAIDWLARARSFETLAVAEPFTVNLNFAGREPDYVAGARVTDRFFTMLGTSVINGRMFLPEEYRKGAPRVVILGHALWQARFGGDPAIVGRALRLDPGNAYTVVGVTPRALDLRLFDDRAKRPDVQLWFPKPGFEPAETQLRVYGAFNVLGRLRPGVAAGQAQSEMDAISDQLAQQYRKTNARIAAQVVPLRTHLAGGLAAVLPFLLAAAAILLLVACANVASLLLARGATRTREFAVRQALGASRMRLIRQMLVESLLLAIAGGTAGLLLARWLLEVAAHLRPRDIALLEYFSIDARSAALAYGVTIVAAMASGIMPAVHLSRPASANALKEGRTGARRGVGNALVVVEVAAAMVLAVAAGLLLRSFLLLAQVDPGFARDRVSVLQIFASTRINTPEKRIVFVDQVLDRMRGLPGVVAAGGVTAMPFGEAQVIARGIVDVAGRPSPPGDDAFAYTTAVTGDYFQTTSVPLLAGRLFDRTDTATSRQVVLVSRRAAQQFWKGADPVGARVRFQFSGTAFDAEVVGVVGDVRHEALDAPAAAEIFLPYAQSGFRALTFVVRAAPGSTASLDALKEQIWSVDPQQIVYSAATLDRLVSKTLGPQRFTLFVLGGFAAVTLLLAAAGVYGVMSFSTGQRAREFGIRVALGATRGQVLRLVLREGMTLAALGVVLGVAVALPLMRLLQSLLFGITPMDPLTFTSVAIGLACVGAGASYLPARRVLNAHVADVLRLE